MISEVLFASVYACGMLVFAIYHVCSYRKLRRMKDLQIDMVAPLFCLAGQVGQTGSATNNECDVCPICLEPFEFCHDLRRTVCGHLYCAECIQKWLYRTPICPLCNRAFISQKC